MRRVALFAAIPVLFNVVSGAVITYDPVVGAVTPNSIDIFVHTTKSASVALQLWPPTGPVRTTPTQVTQSGTNFSARFHLASLSPDTIYRYRVLVNSVLVGPERTFETAPRLGAVRPLRVAVFADSNENGRYDVYGAALADQPDLLVQLGDFPHWNPSTKTPVTIANWHLMNRTVLAHSFYGPHIPAALALRSVPLVHAWDDHDYCTNNANKTCAYKAIARQAFDASFPSYPRPNPTAGIWHSFRYAQCEFFLLDLRSQKDNATIADGPTKSMLDGDDIPNDQLTWLLNGLLSSTAPCKVILSSLSWNPTVGKGEAWRAYAYERTLIANWIDTKAVTGVFVLSGDIHSGGGCDDGTNSGLPECTIPATNITLQLANGCTGGYCGDWNLGFNDPAPRAGYLIVDFGVNGGVRITIKGYTGDVRQVVTLWP